MTTERNFPVGQLVIWKKFEYRSNWLGKATRTLKVLPATIIEEPGGWSIALIELQDRTRVWADAGELEEHNQHTWEMMLDEMTGEPYEICHVCNMLKEELPA